MMLSFHNDQAIKHKYVDRMRAHINADNLIRGTGWKDGKGCAIGCTLENYDHKQYEIELGIPEWLARVKDKLHEGMSVKKSKKDRWPQLFLESILPGVSEKRFEREVKGPFLIIVLKSALSSFDHKKFPDVVKAIYGSIALWKRQDIGSKEWLSAARDANDAAYAAARAARAAHAAAYAAADAARSAACSAAYTARGAAYAAAYAATYAADAADVAYADKYDYFADELIKLLKAL